MTKEPPCCRRSAPSSTISPVALVRRSCCGKDPRRLNVEGEFHGHAAERQVRHWEPQLERSREPKGAEITSAHPHRDVARCGASSAKSISSSRVFPSRLVQLKAGRATHRPATDRSAVGRIGSGETTLVRKRHPPSDGGQSTVGLPRPEYPGHTRRRAGVAGSRRRPRWPASPKHPSEQHKTEPRVPNGSLRATRIGKGPAGARKSIGPRGDRPRGRRISRSLFLPVEVIEHTRASGSWTKSHTRESRCPDRSGAHAGTGWHGLIQQGAPPDAPPRSPMSHPPLAGAGLDRRGPGARMASRWRIGETKRSLVPGPLPCNPCPCRGRGVARSVLGESSCDSATESPRLHSLGSFSSSPSSCRSALSRRGSSRAFGLTETASLMLASHPSSVILDQCAVDDNPPGYFLALARLR